MDTAVSWTFVSSDRYIDLFINNLPLLVKLSRFFSHLGKVDLIPEDICAILLERCIFVWFILKLQDTVAISNLRFLELIRYENAYLFL